MQDLNLFLDFYTKAGCEYGIKPKYADSNHEEHKYTTPYVSSDLKPYRKIHFADTKTCNKYLYLMGNIT